MSILCDWLKRASIFHFDHLKLLHLNWLLGTKPRWSTLGEQDALPRSMTNVTFVTLQPQDHCRHIDLGIIGLHVACGIAVGNINCMKARPNQYDLFETPWLVPRGIFGQKSSCFSLQVLENLTPLERCHPLNHSDHKKWFTLNNNRWEPR
jgi:hypothetical protein